MRDRFTEARAQIKVPLNHVSTYRTKGAFNQELHKVLASRRRSRVGNVEVAEDHESKLHTAVCCEVHLAKLQEWEKVPNVPRNH